MAKIHARRAQLDDAMRDACSDLFYSVHSKKQRDRACMLKKFQAAQLKLSTMADKYKPEATLRILRSYRVSLLHEYCQQLRKDAYLETVKL